MSGIDWQKLLHLPDTVMATDGAPISKAKLIRQGDLTKTEQKLLSVLDNLTYVAAIQASKAQIAAVHDAVYDVSSVVYLHCGLRNDTGVSEFVRLLHTLFYNPTVLLLEHQDGRVGLSVVLKRKNQAEKGATVIEQAATTRLFNQEDQPWPEYLADVSFDMLPQSDLVSYTRVLCERTQRARAIRTLGFYPRCRDADIEQLMGLVRDLGQKDSQLRDLKAQRKASDFRESTAIRMQISKVQKERDVLVTQIKELCHE